MKDNCRQSQINVKEETWGKESQQQQARVDEKERRRRGELFREEEKELSRTDGLKVNRREEEEDLVEGIYSEPTTIMPQPKEAQETPLTRHSTARWTFFALSCSPLVHLLTSISFAGAV